MDTILKARENTLKKLNAMVRRIEGVDSFILIGDNQCRPSDISVVLSCPNEAEIKKVYSDINFLITEFFKSETQDFNEGIGLIVKTYTINDDLTVKVSVCADTDFPAAEWWLPYFDKSGAAQAAYASAVKHASDPLMEQPEAPTDDFEDDFDDDFDDSGEQEAQSNEEEAPVPDSTADDSSDVEKGADELWEYVYSRVALAKRAAAGGSLIHASEIVNELRTELIKLICQKSGITDDYIYSIDLLSNDYQKKLAKTYPACLENGAVISALAAELSLFEKLI